MRKYEYECNCVSTVEYEPTYCKLRQYVFLPFKNLRTCGYPQLSAILCSLRTFSGIRPCLLSANYMKFTKMVDKCFSEKFQSKNGF